MNTGQSFAMRATCAPSRMSATISLPDGKPIFHTFWRLRLHFVVA
ncbi:hypothetical protein [Methylocystis echinoides]|nr:hypothetical protein [Methylocystis echinoides]